MKNNLVILYVGWCKKFRIIFRIIFNILFFYCQNILILFINNTFIDINVNSFSNHTFLSSHLFFFFDVLIPIFRHELIFLFFINTTIAHARSLLPTAIKKMFYKKINGKNNRLLSGKKKLLKSFFIEFPSKIFHYLTVT